MVELWMLLLLQLLGLPLGALAGYVAITFGERCETCGRRICRLKNPEYRQLHLNHDVERQAENSGTPDSVNVDAHGEAQAADHHTTSTSSVAHGVGQAENHTSDTDEVAHSQDHVEIPVPPSANEVVREEQEVRMQVRSQSNERGSTGWFARCSFCGGQLCLLKNRTWWYLHGAQAHRLYWNRTELPVQ